MFFPLVIEKNIACQSDIKRFFPPLRLQEWGAIIVEREMDYLRLAASLPWYWQGLQVYTVLPTDTNWIWK